MHAIYMINGTSGETIWTLGGKANDFVELPYPDGKSFSNSILSMAWQHHANFYPGSDEKEITLFDNHVIDGDLQRLGYHGCKMQECSRGVHFRIDAEGANKTVQLLQEYHHPVGLASVSQGSVQVLDNGNVFIGWGRNPSFTEHTPDGECVLDVQFSPWRERDRDEGLDNYRAYKLDWFGMPYWKPDIAAERSRAHGDVSVWVSWNGATEVHEWALLASDSPDDLDGADKTVALVKRDGFETEFWLPRLNATHVRAAALNAAGDVIGSTAVVELATGRVTEAEYPITEADVPVLVSNVIFVTFEEMGTGDWGGVLLRLVAFGLAIWVLKRLFSHSTPKTCF